MDWKLNFPKRSSTALTSINRHYKISAPESLSDQWLLYYPNQSKHGPQFSNRNSWSLQITHFMWWYFYWWSNDKPVAFWQRIEGQLHLSKDTFTAGLYNPDHVPLVAFDSADLMDILCIFINLSEYRYKATNPSSGWRLGTRILLAQAWMSFAPVWRVCQHRRWCQAALTLAALTLASWYTDDEQVSADRADAADLTITPWNHTSSSTGSNPSKG